MKRILSILTLLLAVETIVLAEINGIEYEITSPSTVKVIQKRNWEKYSGDIVIPESVEIGRNTYRVTSIGDFAFERCDLTSVTIPNSVTSIGIDAFYCSGLTSVTIPNSVTYISDGAFHWCSRLTSVSIGSSVTSIGNSAFEGCSGLTSVTIPNSVTSIGDYAFNGCSGLTSVSIGSSVTSIGDRAFSNCSGLTTVTIPNSVTFIGDWTFRYCNNLTSVTIGSSVTSVGDGAFDGCDSLRRIKVMTDVPPSLSSIIYVQELEVPFGCIDKYIHTNYWNEIASIYAINNGNKYVGIQLEEDGESIVRFTNSSNSFFEVNVNEVVEVKAKNDLTQYSCVLFHGNKDVSDIFCQNGCYSFRPSAESYKDNFIKTYAPTKMANVINAGTLLDQIGVENVEHLSHLKVSGNLNGTDIMVIRKMTNLKYLDMTDATIINGGQSYYQSYTTSQYTIGDYFFKDKEKLEIILLPKNTKEIKDCSFEGCKNLISITIPDSVTSIGRSTFRDCNNLTSLTIGSSVTSIGYGAFSGCSSLTYLTILCPFVESWFELKKSIKEVVLGNGVTCIYGGFYGCSGLTSVTIGNGVTFIGDWTFRYCNNLTSLTIGSSVTYIGDYAFEECNNLISVNISDVAAWCNINFHGYYSNPLSYAQHLYLNGEEVKDLIIPNSVTSIGNSAFEGCSGLTSVTIPNSVTSIGDYAFYGCSGLTSVTISDVAAWCNINFHGYYSNPLSCAHHLYLNGEEVKDLIIPNSVTSIGNSVFGGCSGLTSVTIPNSVTSIGDYAFYGCSGLTSVTIPNSVTSIGDYTFSRCSNLTSVIIGEDVTSIGNSAFEGCSGLTTVTSLNTTPPEIKDYTFEKDTYANATLKVPTGCKTIYWLHPYWENFNKMEEIDISDVKTIKTDEYNGIGIGKVYNLNGELLSVKGDEINTLPKGIYIFNGQKVVIK